MIKEYGIAPALVLAGGLVLAAIIGGAAFYSTKTLGNTLTVTGSATATTTADIGKLSASVSRMSYEDGLFGAQTRVAADTQVVVNFFTKSGIPAENILVSPIFMDREYSNDSNAPTRYSVRQEVSIESDDPQLVEKLSKDISQLAGRVLVWVRSPEFYISNLPELRVQLIGRAVADAKARAEAIAESTGQRVGKLQSASSGVVQVMSPNSIEVSDYGSYDTSTIEKQVMVTARAVFRIR